MSEHLVVVSKVKKMVKDKAGMNTASSVMDELTKIIEREIEVAVENAKKDKRKTVMDRDFTGKTLSCN
ncbi:MAG: hypothetical protein KDD60_11140 [Bdellovibrionales bacterium]|nr:hypothetical protein [Bdellovibrionales bacterium]